MSNIEILKINNTNLQTIFNTIDDLLPDQNETPEISVASNGLITAIAGTKTSTYQLAFQPVKTITPNTVNQIAVSSGYYTGGDVTVTGDSNLIAGNIKKNVSIFGVTGTLEASNTGYENTIIDRKISGTYINDKVTKIGINAFASCSNLTTVDFPNCSRIGNNAFANCSSLTSVSFPICTNIDYDAFAYCSSLISVDFPKCSYIGDEAFGRCSSLISVSFLICTNIYDYAFYNCSNLTTVNIPNCSKIGNNAFANCSSLTSVSFPNCSYISYGAFANCSSLSKVILGYSSVCTLNNSNAFSSTLMSTTGYFYVPSSLLTLYQSATNWTYYSSRFSTIESL